MATSPYLTPGSAVAGQLQQILLERQAQQQQQILNQFKMAEMQEERAQGEAASARQARLDAEAVRMNNETLRMNGLQEKNILDSIADRTHARASEDIAGAMPGALDRFNEPLQQEMMRRGLTGETAFEGPTEDGGVLPGRLDFLGDRKAQEEQRLKNAYATQANQLNAESDKPLYDALMGRSQGMDVPIPQAETYVPYDTDRGQLGKPIAGKAGQKILPFNRPQPVAPVKSTFSERPSADGKSLIRTETKPDGTSVSTLIKVPEGAAYPVTQRPTPVGVVNSAAYKEFLDSFRNKTTTAPAEQRAALEFVMSTASVNPDVLGVVRQRYADWSEDAANPKLRTQTVQETAESALGDSKFDSVEDRQAAVALMNALMSPFKSAK